MEKAWHDVHVGDVLKVKDGELFSADLLCLHCALAERICYVTTTNLDGETNLKVKRCVPGLLCARRNHSSPLILGLGVVTVHECRV